MEATPLYNISFPGKEAETMLDKLPLNGKKTYVVAIVTVIYAVCGILLGDMPTNEAMMLIAGALGITTIGHKIDKSKPITMELGETTFAEFRTFTPNEDPSSQE